MPVSKRTGKRYAAGSQKKWAGWEPRVCRDCGLKLTLNSNAMNNYDHILGQAWSLCSDCLIARRAA